MLFKRMLAVSFLITIVGCDRPTDLPDKVVYNPGNVTVILPKNDELQNKMVITRLNQESDRNRGLYGRWNLIELKYKGKTHVYLQNYDGDNQMVVPVTVTDEKPAMSLVDYADRLGAMVHYYRKRIEEGKKSKIMINPDSPIGEGLIVAFAKAGFVVWQVDGNFIVTK